MALPDPNKPASINKNLFTMGFVLLLVGLALFWYMVLPNIKTAKKDNIKAIGEKEAIDADLAAILKAKEELGNSMSKLSSVGIDQTRLELSVPTNEDMPRVYLVMENLLVSQGKYLSRTNYTVSPPVADKSGGARIPITLSAVGSFMDLKELVKQAQNAMRPVIITDISMQTAVPANKEETAESLRGKYQMTATGYIRAISLSSSYEAKKTK